MYKKELTVDITLPVYNEENVLRHNTLVLHDYLDKTADFTWDIIIADNASNDKTPEIAKALSLEYDRIKYQHIPIKGRGYVLREALLRSNADVVSWMDIDLATNIRYFKLLIEGIRCGYDVSIGSRLMQGSRIKRRLNREIFSRVYNCLIKLLFFNRFSDAQCGFKAFRTNIAQQFLPLVKNNNWFFDTELLLLLEYNKYRIFEVPVEWIEDIKSKVHITKTVLEDLAGLLRMRCTIHKKRLRERG